ncbi:chemotaxis protein CheA [Sporomusa sp.]|uniref:chemotaxis protein CheA n=1 Tax=Sporomusa sp. TaxID=2078658 RepID=UPI002CC54799|nr:chemotaxis protein CheA [Sporomusa sp.]HWR07862.1 chemotaxis protein CheA [Sporomusa sp.]
MTKDYSQVTGPELFVFETNQLLDKLEQLILDSEKSNGLETSIDEVFRIMHTIKGSAAMMSFNDISTLAHSMEDVFYYLRENKPETVDYSALTDLVLYVVDFIKGETTQMETGNNLTGDCSLLNDKIKTFLAVVKKVEAQTEVCSPQPADAEIEYCGLIKACELSGDSGQSIYKALIYFDDDCGMDNIRALTLINELSDFSQHMVYFPPDILENDDTAETIKTEGFKILFATSYPLETMEAFFAQTMFLKEFTLETVKKLAVTQQPPKRTIDLDGPLPSEPSACGVTDFGLPDVTADNERCLGGKQSFISVNVTKMDMLMDLVGELVTAEAMVTQNPELQGLNLDKFYKAARQLRKITGELQDVVMSIRMIPLAATFHKMTRIVRDMARKLDKQVELEIIGEQTEVDKNIIENIADPLMHLIRNAVDHGIESLQERIANGKHPIGRIRLEAKNAGGDVWIIVHDDGGGLNREKILHKAIERGLIEEADNTLTDKQVYAFILHPGFSTKEVVTEFSGRGVGMDVVAQNITAIGGAITVDSVAGVGTSMSIRIPLTLAIIDGMIVSVGHTIYTVPIISIKESFRLKDQNLIKDVDNNEMLMIRGQCYPVLRLHERFGIKAGKTDLYEGIMLMVEVDGRSLCLFVDSLLGQQQVVVKALPGYIKKKQGLAGCTLLGDGSVSLILDVAGLL